MPRTTTTAVLVALVVLSSGCIHLEQETPEERTAENIEPRDITVENHDSIVHHFDVSVTYPENDTEIYGDNVSVDPNSVGLDSLTRIDNVTPETRDERMYDVTVNTEDGMNESFDWEIRRTHRTLRIAYRTGDVSDDGNASLSIDQDVE